jgi:hypothetical protein
MRRSTGLLLALFLPASAPFLAPAPARAMTSEVTTNEALLDTLQHLAFNYFWFEANPANGMIRDRSQGGSPASIAAVGFGLSALCIGSDHGWITRAAAVDRVKTTLYTLWTKPQGPASSGTIGYKGLYYHFLDMNAALRMTSWDTELSTIDTALLFAGVLDARQYFLGSDTSEVRIRALADSITQRANWRFMRNSSPGIAMGWKPSGGFFGYGKWTGYNEAMIMYHIAMGNPVIANRDTSSDWGVWTVNYQYQTQYGQTYVIFPPLFGHQYSHCWVDYRYHADQYMRNRGITYFENSRRATLAQRAYAIANPLGHVGYSDSLWGLTASDVPTGYSARGAPPAQNDDGTITPTAPLSSIPFAPEECLAVAWYLWNHYRDTPLWGPYGARDAFNLTVDPDWYDTDYLGIDQGPIVLMIENYRTGKVWWRNRLNADYQRGLEAAGFLPVVASVPEPVSGFDAGLRTDPNPFVDLATVRFRLAAPSQVRLTLHDVQGREVARLIDGVRSAGAHAVPLSGRGLPSGVYLYRLESEGRTWTQRCVLIR